MCNIKLRLNHFLSTCVDISPSSRQHHKGALFIKLKSPIPNEINNELSVAIDVTPFAISFDRSQALSEAPRVIELWLNDYVAGAIDESPLTFHYNISKPFRKPLVSLKLVQGINLELGVWLAISNFAKPFLV